MTRGYKSTAAAATEDQSESRDERADIVSATGELSDTHDVITGVGTLGIEAEGVPPDERADIVPAATGDLSDTHDVITGVRAVELDTAEGVPRYERADIVPTATRDWGDIKDVIGVETYDLDSPDQGNLINRKEQ